MTTPIRHVTCIGCGLMGSGWAAHFLRSGLDVTVYDPDPARAAYTVDLVEKAWPSLEKLGLAKGARRDRLRIAKSLEEALDGAIFVQESATENQDLKIALLADIERRLPEEGILSSSSSGFLAADLRRKCKNGGRVIVGHPFNPPYLVPLVEIAGVDGANDGVVERARAFYEATGMKVVTLNREIRGYVANRMQSAVLREVLYMLDQGVATVEDIDAALSFGPARRWAFMGLSTVFYLGGGSPEGYRRFVDLIVNELAEGYAAPGDFHPSPALVDRYVKEMTDWMSSTTYDALRRRRDDGLVAVNMALAEAFPDEDPTRS